MERNTVNASALLSLSQQPLAGKKAQEKTRTWKWRSIIPAFIDISIEYGNSPYFDSFGIRIG
jgi:hypothetical protein